MSEQSSTNQLLSFATVTVVFLTAVFNVWAARQAAKAATAAQKVAEKTHVLVNSQYGTALKLLSERAMRIADLSGTKEDIDAAVDAKQKYMEHEVKQAIVDMKEAIT